MNTTQGSFVYIILDIGNCLSYVAESEELVSRNFVCLSLIERAVVLKSAIIRIFFWPRKVYNNVKQLNANMLHFMILICVHYILINHPSVVLFTALLHRLILRFIGILPRIFKATMNIG